MKHNQAERAYPQSFAPDALWNREEILGYLSISSTIYYEIEPELKTFKIGARRVAFAADVIAFAKRMQREQNPMAAGA